MKEFIEKFWVETILTAIIGALAKVVHSYNKKIKSLKTSYCAIESAMLEITKAKLIDIYHEYKHKKCIPLYIKELFEGLYQSYKALGGNGIMTRIHDEVMSWDIEED